MKFYFEKFICFILYLICKINKLILIKYTMKEILCMLIGAVIAIFASFALPEKYQEKFILGFSLIYAMIYVILRYNLFGIWDTIYY